MTDFIHFQERFQTYMDSLDPIHVLVWMEGVNVSKSISIQTCFTENASIDPCPHQHERYMDLFLSTFESISKLISIQWI